jgi:hypothetical protein
MARWPGVPAAAGPDLHLWLGVSRPQEQKNHNSSFRTAHDAVPVCQRSSWSGALIRESAKV